MAKSIDHGNAFADTHSKIPLEILHLVSRVVVILVLVVVVVGFVVSVVVVSSLLSGVVPEIIRPSSVGFRPSSVVVCRRPCCPAVSFRRYQTQCPPALLLDISSQVIFSFFGIH